jgi:fibronectin-binding autotransporter adhesin
MFACAQSIWATNGTWNAGAAPDNYWSTTGNWVSGTVADGLDGTATFNMDVEGPGAQTVDLDYYRIIGNITFGDTDTISVGGWIINDVDLGGGYYTFLTLDVSPGTGTTPVMSMITVNDLGTGAVATLNVGLQPNDYQDGLVKAGTGTLVMLKSMVASYDSTPYAGGVRIENGTLQLGADNIFLADGFITLTAGTLDLQGFTQETSGVISLQGGTVTSGTIKNTGTNAFAIQGGTIQANLTEDLNSVGLTKSTGATAVLSGLNSYTGPTMIEEGLLRFSNASAYPIASSVTINSGGALAATGPYTSAKNWLASGEIVSTSDGALAISQDEGNINMAGYANLSLGAVGTVTYTGTLTPVNNVYRLGGGGGTLILSRENSLTDSSSRSLVVSGPGVVELSNSNNYSGGTTLEGGVLRIGNINSIGGPTSRLTFNGGELEVNNSGLSIDNNDVNWSTFDGGFTIDPGVTFTINQNVSGGGTLSKGGYGTLNIGGSFAMSDWVNLDSGTTIIEPGATFEAGLGVNMVNGSGRGQVIISEPGSNATTLMRVTAGVAGDYTGWMKLGGGIGGKCVVNIYGNNTTLETTSPDGENMISMGEWGNVNSTINIYDGATLRTGWLYIAKWNFTKGTVNLYDNAKLEVNNISVGSAGAGGGVLNMYGNSSITATATDSTNGIIYVEENGFQERGLSVINMSGHASITAGEVRLSQDNWWSDASGILNATGNSTITTLVEDGVSTGNLVVGAGGNGDGYLNLTDDTVVTVGGSLRIGETGNSNGQVNVSGNAQINAAAVEVSLSTGPGTFRTLNVLENGRVTTTGDFSQGATGVISGGNVNVTDNGLVQVGGNYLITYGTLTVNSTVGTPVVDVTGDFTVGASPAAYNTTGTVNLGGNGTLKVGGNLNLVTGTLSCSSVSTAAGADGRVQLTGGGSALTFDGGTISPTASNATFMQGLPNAYIRPGGALINTAGFDITIAQNLADDPYYGGGILTKQGAGTLVLSGSNTYSYGTNVEGGVLDFANLNAIPIYGYINVNGGVLRFSSSTAVPQTGSVVINTRGALEVNASDPYTTVTAWLGSNKIQTASTGAIAISADSNENINMGSYSSLSLGSTGSWTYTGTLTPAGGIYNLGGGGGTLYLSNNNALTGVGNSLVVNGPGLVVLQGSNDYGNGTTLNGGTLSYTDNNSIGGAASAITFNGGLLMVPVGTANDLGSHVVNWSSFNGGFDVTPGDTLTITQQISGSGSLTKGGAGTLVLTNQNYYSGGTNIYYGTLQLSGGTNRLPTTGSIVVTTGTLDLGGNTQDITSGNVTVAGGTIQNGTLNKTDITNPIYAQSGTISAKITGTTALSKTTSGTLTLTAANTYSGGTTINNGLLQLSGAGRLPTTTGGLTISGGTLDLGGVSQAVGSQAVVFQGGTVQNGTITKSRGYYDARSGTVNAVLARTGAFTVSLTKITTGTFVLGAAATYNGLTNIQGGTLLFSGGNNMLPTAGAITIGNSFLSGGTNRGTLDLGGYSQTTTGAITIQDGYIQNGTLINNGANYIAQSGTVSAELSGTAGLTKSNFGDSPSNSTLILSGANTYTGGTILQAGTLELDGGDNRLPTTGDVRITGGVLDLGGNSQTTSGALSIQGGTVENGTIIKSGAAYDARAGLVAAVLDGAVGLNKTTDDMLTLIAANTYTGGTTIAAGTLQLNGGNNRLATTGNITITGGVLDFALDSQSTSGAVSFQGGEVRNGTIIKSGAAYDGQAGIVSANLQGAVGLTKTATGTLTLNGVLTYTGVTDVQAGTLQINSTGTTALSTVTGASAGTLGIGDGLISTTITADSVSVGSLRIAAGSKLTINAISGGALSSTLSPVPEPSALLMLSIAALGLIWAAWRRKR